MKLRPRPAPVPLCRRKNCSRRLLQWGMQCHLLACLHFTSMTSIFAIEQPTEVTPSLLASGTPSCKRIRLASDNKDPLQPSPEHANLDEPEDSNRETSFNSKDHQLDPIADNCRESDPEPQGDGNCRKDAIATKTETDVYIAIINIVRPKESVLTAMQRLGEFMTESHRYCRKNTCIRPLREPFSTTPAEQTANKQSSQELTTLCDKMVAFGRFDIYEETYEQVVQTLREAGAIAPDWRTGEPVQAIGRDA